jgi:ATP-dependent Clp protease protease subunit
MYSRRQPGCDITICLNTNGGEMIAGFYLYDYLQELRSRGHHLTVKVFGGAFSHGVTILQAADRRVISENATLLIHEAQLEELSGNYSQIFKQGKGRLDKYQDKLLTILAARSTMSKARIKNRWSNNDWTLTAEEALKYGFVDEIQSAPSFG